MRPDRCRILRYSWENRSLHYCTRLHSDPFFASLLVSASSSSSSFSFSDVVFIFSSSSIIPREKKKTVPSGSLDRVSIRHVSRSQVGSFCSFFHFEISKNSLLSFLSFSLLFRFSFVAEFFGDVTLKRLSHQQDRHVGISILFMISNYLIKKKIHTRSGENVRTSSGTDTSHRHIPIAQIQIAQLKETLFRDKPTGRVSSIITNAPSTFNVE